MGVGWPIDSGETPGVGVLVKTKINKLIYWRTLMRVGVVRGRWVAASWAYAMSNTRGDLLLMGRGHPYITPLRWRRVLNQ